MTSEMAVDEISTGGQKYLPQKDGSFLAQGYAPTKHTVKLTVKTSMKDIRAFRLELLTDPNLPLGGPGRSIKGTGALTEFKVDAAPASAPWAAPAIAPCAAPLSLANGGPDTHTSPFRAPHAARIVAPAVAAPPLSPAVTLPTNARHVPKIPLCHSCVGRARRAPLPVAGCVPLAGVQRDAAVVGRRGGADRPSRRQHSDNRQGPPRASS